MAMVEKTDTVPASTMGGEPITLKMAVGVPVIAGGIAGLWVAEHALDFLPHKPWRQELAFHAKGTAIGALSGLAIGTLAWTLLRDKDPAESMRRRAAQNAACREDTDQMWAERESKRRASVQDAAETLTARR